MEMFWHYFAVARLTPGVMYDNANSLAGFVGLAVVAMTWFNAELADRLHFRNWHGVRRHWAFAPLAVLAVCSFLQVEFDSRQRLEERAEVAETAKVRAEADLIAERSTPAKQRLKEVEEENRRQQDTINRQAQANQQRMLDSRASEKLRAVVAKMVAYPSNPPAVAVIPMFSDTESGVYAEQIASVFRTAGWKVADRSYRRAPLYGVSIRYSEGLEPLANVFNGIFEEIGIEVTCRTVKSSGSTIDIIVGSKPPPDYSGPIGPCAERE